MFANYTDLYAEAFSHDETLIAAGSERGDVIRVFAINALLNGDKQPLFSWQAVASRASRLVFSSDDRLLAATAYTDATRPDTLLLVWDVSTGALLLEERVDAAFGAGLAFSANEAQVSFVAEGRLYTFDIPATPAR